MQCRKLQGAEMINVNVKIPGQLLGELDAQCQPGMFHNRSDLIRRAVREWLDRQARDRERGGQAA